MELGVWTNHTTVEAAEIIKDLAAKEPLYRRDFMNMFSPDSVNECRFCGADDYNGSAVVHRASCVWQRARAFLD